MKLRNVLLTSILVIIIVAASAFSVFADEGGFDLGGLLGTLGITTEETAEEDGEAGFDLGGLLGTLGITTEETAGEDGEAGFDLGGLLGTLGITSEETAEEDGETGFDLGGLLGTLGITSEETAEEDGETGFDLGGLLDTLGIGEEGFSLDSLDGLLGSLLGGTEDGDSEGWGDFDLLFEATNKVNEAIKTYIKDKNAEIMDPGEVQIVTISTLWEPETFSGQEEEFQELDNVVQFNYNLDEENQLRFVSGVEDVALFTLQKNEDGSYTIADAEFAEEGENYMPSIEALCEKVGKPIDECKETLAFAQWMVLFELRGYLDEHPEVTGIEYDGEIRTAEELSEIQSELLTELSAIYEEEDAAEEPAEEAAPEN